VRLRRPLVILFLGAGAAGAIMMLGREHGSPSPGTVGRRSGAPTALRPARRYPAPRGTVPRLAATSTCPTPPPDDVDHAAATADGRPRDLTDLLQPPPPWLGPRPTSFDDVPKTPAVAARVEEYGGPSSVDQMLKFLDGMQKCLEPRTLEKAGGVSMEFSYALDYTQGTIKGVDVFLDQSTLGEGDDLAVLDCARQLHVGRVHKIGPETGKALEDAPDFVWRTMLRVPVKDDVFYSWLLTDKPATL
jgi:hypothetical protein